MSDDGTHGWLKRDVDTKWGTYARGSEVLILKFNGKRIVVCMDNGSHLGKVCHAMTLDRSVVGIEP